jgi:TolB-like protein
LKNQMRKTLRNALFATLTLLVLGSVAPAYAAPARVAVLPFDVHAEKDLTFLQEGILDMLGSRLAWREKVEVINENETKAALASIEGFEGESRALLVGGKLQADYVLFGSLTVFGESVSIDARMVDVSGQQAPLPFFAQTRAMGEVIPQINQFATDINATVFGRGVAQRPVAATAPQASAAPATGAQQPVQQAYDPRMHPEKLLQSGVQGETQVPIAGQPYQAPNPAFIAAPGATNTANQPKFWRSHNIKALITGIDVGDVDKDGLQEIVIAEDKVVTINRIVNGRLLRIGEAGKIRIGTHIGVDVGDVNGNGTPEIYVSSVGGPKSDVVESFVLEYNGKEYGTIYGPNNWYYRVAKTIDRGTVLLGQRQKTAVDSIFREAIHEMLWEGSRITLGPLVLKGGIANLMGVTYDDITQSGQSLIVAYSDWDRVRIYSGASQMIYEDADRTGGNLLSFNLRQEEPGVQNKQFFPLRIRTTDIDQDGKAEVMVVSHDELAKSLLKNFRSFKRGKIQLMEWDGMGLVPKWNTQEFAGRVSDFVVADFDNDGQDELVVAIVAKEGSIAFTNSLSKVIAFDLDRQ